MVYFEDPLINFRKKANELGSYNSILIMLIVLLVCILQLIIQD